MNWDILLADPAALLITCDRAAGLDSGYREFGLVASAGSIQAACDRALS